MKNFCLVLLLLLPGCQSTKPTYIDIPREQLQAIAQQFNVSIEDLFLTHRNRLKAELSDELGMEIEVLYEDEDFDGRIDEVVTVQVQSAIKAALSAAAGEMGGDGRNPTNWVLAGIAGLGALLAGGYGLRGRQRRKKDGKSKK